MYCHWCIYVQVYSKTHIYIIHMICDRNIEYICIQIRFSFTRREN